MIVVACISLAVILLFFDLATFHPDTFIPSSPIPHFCPPQNSTRSHIPTSPKPGLYPFNEPDWKRFAWFQYATTPAYLCNSLMILDSLDHLETRAEKVLVYPNEWDSNPVDRRVPALLQKAREKYKPQLMPVNVKSVVGKTDANDSRTWAETFVKLLVFNQTGYDRVISLDSDTVVLKNMDELFFLPRATVAMPRAYWIKQKPGLLASIMVVVEPSHREWTRVEQAIINRKEGEFDMEILNSLYNTTALILPHRTYGLLTEALRNNDIDERTGYLGNPEEGWDARRVVEEAKFVHFSDWPVPKPWVKAGEVILKQHGPKCDDEENCPDRDAWTRLRDEFVERRVRVCGEEWRPR